MFVTVAICTWNRAKLLDQTLSQLKRIHIPQGVSWELLVVNNCCTDDTDAVIARHAATLPLRRLVETRPGLSNARNCAVAAARGELLIWTDDDVLVDHAWLREYVRAAREWPEAVFLGGTVNPWFSKTPPRWIAQNLTTLLYGAYAIRQLGDGTRLLAPDELPFGANLAFRTEALRAFPFNSTLGNAGANLIAGEETDVIRRLREAGYAGVWVGSARVRHYISPERLTKRYLWRYFSGNSRGQHRTQLSMPGVHLWGAPRWLWRKYYTSRLVEMLLAPARSRRWLEVFLRSAALRGIIDEERDKSRARSEAWSRAAIA